MIEVDVVKGYGEDVIVSVVEIVVVEDWVVEYVVRVKEVVVGCEVRCRCYYDFFFGDFGVWSCLS